MGRPKKAAKKSKATSEAKVITIGRLDSELKQYYFSDGETVGMALDKAGISLALGEEVNDLSGTELSLNDKLKDSMTLIVVSNHKNA